MRNISSKISGILAKICLKATKLHKRQQLIHENIRQKSAMNIMTSMLKKFFTKFGEKLR